MRVRWTAAAASDLEDVAEYLEKQHPERVQDSISTIYERVQSLLRMPHRGRPGRVANTRELVVLPLPFIVFYRVQKETVEVLRILHAARDWTSLV